MTTVNVYLMFDGNCEQAFKFYQSVFGGEIPYMGRYGDMPPSEAGKVSTDADKIMHVSLPISKETVLMGSDCGGEWAADYKQGTNFSISINTDSQKEADRLFGALSDGGLVKMAMNQTFWGDYFGMLTDKFGVNWMVSFSSKPKT